MIQDWINTIYTNKAIQNSGERFDFESLAVGFFMAKGKTMDEALALYDECVKQGCF